MLEIKCGERMRFADGRDVMTAGLTGGGCYDDPVDHPTYYNDGNIEVVDFILDKKLDFCLGNAIKYICRAGKKDPDKTVEDLQKAIKYLEFEIEEMRK